MNEGLKITDNVVKVEAGSPVHGCLVLPPDKDMGAVTALQAYADATPNKSLAADIYDWLGDLGERHATGENQYEGNGLLRMDHRPLIEGE